MAYTYIPYPRMLFRGPDNCTVQNYTEEQGRVKDGWGHVPGWVAPEVEADVVVPVPVPVEVVPAGEDETVAAVEPRGFTRGRGRPRKT